MRLMVAMLLVVGLGGFVSAQDAQWSWQKPHAKVLPEGDLQWAPMPFSFEEGSSVRYIDFENGDDRNTGETTDSPWKHHPWDAAATERAAQCSGVHAYVFKRGVTYRGTLSGDESGKPGEPIRLTSDPSWGEGEALISGSVRIRSAWKRADTGTAPEGMPEPSRVWYTDLAAGHRPWTLWLVEGDEVTRLPLARTPNWEEVDPQDVMSQWWEWEWGEAGIAEQTIEGKDRLNYGTDPEHLTLPPEAYEQAFMYTEWGPVMGTPAAREVVKFDPETHTIYFGGFWGGGGQRIFGGNRYYLENSPYFLDEGGEWWFDEEAGRLYLRLPDEGDPNKAHLEAGHSGTLVSLASGTRHVEVSGLTFRFTNVAAPNRRPFSADVDVACVRLTGTGDDLRVHHCRFEHINRAVKFKASGGHDVLNPVSVTDNEIVLTDHGAISVQDGSHWGLREPPKGVLRRAEVLRNRLYKIGMRPPRGEHGHALQVSFPEAAEIAGNMLDRCYGAGLFIFGGKPSGYLGDAPMSRILIHHNKVTDPLVKTNDWGGIETWQGGPYYVFNNISGNPGGFWHWQQRHFGFAYYLDGSFKNYHFNNIAWGNSNEKQPHGNTSAFQEIHSFQNTFFNNSVFRFVVGTRRQAPQAGRDLFLGNIWEDIGDWYFWHASPAASPAEANQAHVGEVGGEFAYETNGYAGNVFAGAPQHFGCFEANGMPHESLGSMREALKARHALASGLGEPQAASLFRNAKAHDFRLEQNSPADGRGVRVFVPWALYGMVGEWNFRINHKDPAHLIDDHWYMKPYYGPRTTYHEMPHHPLRAVNVSADDYVTGDLEDWTRGALTFNGRDQSAGISQAQMDEPIEYRGGKATVPGEDRITLDMDVNNFLIEVHFRTDPGHTGGVLVSKMLRAGYVLGVNQSGGVTLTVRSDGLPDSVASSGRVNDGEWHHVIAEVDRQKQTLAIYVDGRRQATAAMTELKQGDSLSNAADFVVGRGPGGGHFAGAVDFLRVSRGTLADAMTTIEELYAWEFHGPFLRDFLGNAPVDGRDAGAIEYTGEE